MDVPTRIAPSTAAAYKTDVRYLVFVRLLTFCVGPLSPSLAAQLGNNLKRVAASAGQSELHVESLDGHSRSFSLLPVILPVNVRKPTVARDHVENHLAALEIEAEIQFPQTGCPHRLT